MENSVSMNSVAERGVAHGFRAPDRRAVWRLAVGFVIAILILAGLAYTLREDLSAAAPEVTPALPVEVTRPPAPGPKAVVAPATPELRRSAVPTKHRRKTTRPAERGATTAEPSIETLPESPSPAPTTPSRTDLDAPLPH